MFTRAQLLHEVWGYDFFGGTRTVDVHVRRLRAKLGPEYESLIGTVRNVGYKAVRPTAAGRRAASLPTPTKIRTQTVIRSRWPIRCTPSDGASVAAALGTDEQQQYANSSLQQVNSIRGSRRRQVLRSWQTSAPTTCLPLGEGGEKSSVI